MRQKNFIIEILDSVILFEDLMSYIRDSCNLFTTCKENDLNGSLRNEREIRQALFFGSHHISRIKCNKIKCREREIIYKCDISSLNTFEFNFLER